MANNYWQKFEHQTVYHLYNRGIDRKPIFTQISNYHFFLKKWKQLIFPFFETGAYCLLPNHIHFLIWLRPLDKEVINTIKKQGTSNSVKFLEEKINYYTFLEDQFKRLFSSYALAFNKQEGRTGSLFDKRFKRVSVTEERYLSLVAYIHHNPIHHSIAKKYGEWKFCSYAVFKNGGKTALNTKVVNDWFLKEGLDFEQFHHQFQTDYKKLQFTSYEEL